MLSLNLLVNLRIDFEEYCKDAMLKLTNILANSKWTAKLTNNQYSKEYTVMSHILFGDFESQIINQDLINKVKEKLLHENILILFDHELDFSQEIEKMLDEHRSGNTHKFCITTTLQEYNSDDLLFPYDKYSNEELFPNGEDRVVFEKINSFFLRSTIYEIM